jgi:hypothetical protein
VSDFSRCAALSAHLPSDLRAAWHRARAQAWENPRHGFPRAALETCRRRARDHRACAAAFAPLEGRPGGPRDA